MDDEVDYISLIWKLRCYYEENWNERSQFLAHQQSCGRCTSQIIPNGHIWFPNIKYVSCSYGYSNHLEHGFLLWWTSQGDLSGLLGPNVCASFHLILYPTYEFPNNWGDDNKEGQGTNSTISHSIIYFVFHYFLVIRIYDSPLLSRMNCLEHIFYFFLSF